MFFKHWIAGKLLSDGAFNAPEGEIKWVSTSKQGLPRFCTILNDRAMTNNLKHHHNNVDKT
jgi:hypothetical protein